jgi:CRP-like cAMP-binding protein
VRSAADRSFHGSKKDDIVMSDYTRNRILQLLPFADAERLSKLFEPVKLQFKESIYSSGKPIDYIYFPLTGMVSVVVDMEGGQTVEAGTIGREGIVGLPAFLGSPSISTT